VCDQPKTVQERIVNAHNLIEKAQLDGTILVDDMNDQFLKVFAAWPMRYWIVHESKVAYKAMPSVADSGSPAYSMTDLRSALSRIVC